MSPSNNSNRVRQSNISRELKDSMRNPEIARTYLQDALDNDIKDFLVMLRVYVQANGGMNKCAEKTHLSREALYRMLSENGNPELRSIYAILSAYNIRLHIQMNT